MLNALFDVNAPETDRTDIVQAVLQGHPGAERAQGQVRRHAGRHAEAQPRRARRPRTPNRFGVIGGDNAGYPNGRRPTDDVVDIDLQVVAGILVDNAVPLGDGVDRTTSRSSTSSRTWPTPDSGFDSNPGQFVQPAHPPVPPGG